MINSNYDFQAEKQRYNFPNIELYGHTLNRGISEPDSCKGVALRDNKSLEQTIVNTFFPTTLSKKSALLDISLPYSGHYYCSGNDVYFDADVGVAQRLIDDQHPNLIEMQLNLIKHNALLRRESITNDVLISRVESNIKTPQDVSELVAKTASKAFGGKSYKSYMSSSGALAVEAGMKIACRITHHKLIENYGYEFESYLMKDFGINTNTTLTHPEDKLPLYEDYPFFFIAMKGAFHGRSLGALTLTHFRPVQKRGFQGTTKVKHIKFNGDLKELRNIIDSRTLSEIYDAGESVATNVKNGRIPKELVASVVIEPFQGEAGYIIASKQWLSGLGEICKKNNILLFSDEIQSFCRTGKMFASEHYNIQPDIITISKAAAMGITLADARFAEAMSKGWHSSTWGGGKILENNLSWTVINTYLNYRDPVFNNNTYMENQNIKADYIQQVFGRLADKYPRTLLDFHGLGGMWRFKVPDRDEFCVVALKNGLKLLSVGVTQETSAVRAIFLADVLTKEVDTFGRLLEKTIIDIEK